MIVREQDDRILLSALGRRRQGVAARAAISVREASGAAFRNFSWPLPGATPEPGMIVFRECARNRSLLA
jgi:hypothetical protein